MTSINIIGADNIGRTVATALLAGFPDWAGRIVIDANNPIEAPLFKPVPLANGPRRSWWPIWCLARAS
ncbi:hypothetical protein JHL17_19700 [Azospirillum sp. YIM B02556]|uniref:Uncharacterized protein n=1 Tax=Azospirillum endophyticum TaxID=2800326 RepID=A0ABS1F893_9PROT|nr:hypothetical protein [Azospirillum endophyticum]MBK1839638.1 hypothetical protein [Azospirillum endophyticum]